MKKILAACVTAMLMSTTTFQAGANPFGTWGWSLVCALENGEYVVSGHGVDNYTLAYQVCFNAGGVIIETQNPNQ